MIFLQLEDYSILVNQEEWVQFIFHFCFFTITIDLLFELNVKLIVGK